MSKGAHLNLSERIIIEQGLNNNSSKAAIAETLGKDKSSICKEVKKHSFIKKPNSYGHNIGKGTYNCIHMKECGFNVYCTNVCEKQEKIICKHKKKHGVCNGCENKNKCHLEKTIYEANKAQKEYAYDLHDSRSGVDLTSNEANQIGTVLKKGLDNGQSIAVILNNHSEIKQCEKTIYNYINEGVFEISNVKNIDLRSKVKYRVNKKDSVKYKKREDRKYLKGRTYKDFQEYIAHHPNAKIVEMDTVYNDVSNGPFIQTFHFVEYDFMKGVFHTKKEAKDMYEGFKYIKELLGDEFNDFVVVCITDRGSEFIMAEEMESLGVKMFYCDPLASCQKPHVETNHRLFRYICPNKVNLYELGLKSQDDLDLVFSHINSYKREEYHFKSPIDLIEFYCPNSTFLEKLNIKKIDPDDVYLKPDLFKKK